MVEEQCAMAGGDGAAVVVCYVHATIPLNVLPHGALAVDFFSP
jgi:hypothetical protein